MLQTTITKKELMELGYGPGQSGDLIRRAKALMVQKGYGYYNSKGLGRVPISAIEEVLGLKIIFDEDEKVVS